MLQPRVTLSDLERPRPLEIREVAKKFGEVQALAGACFELREGELLGLLGPNGAGKTTLIRAIAGRVRLDGGVINLFGQPVLPKETHPSLGIVPQEIALYGLLTAQENLEVFGRLHGVQRAELSSRVDWALGWTGLADRKNHLVDTFSGGMKRRLNLACAVLHQPRLLLLDEPTVGVDPQSREKIYEMLEALRKEGTSILLTTHHLEEAESRCQRIVIIDHGKIIADGAVGELLAAAGQGERQVNITLDSPAPELASAGWRFEGAVLSGNVRDIETELPELLSRVRAKGRKIDGLEVRTPTLQTLFIQLTGKELRE